VFWSSPTSRKSGETLRLGSGQAMGHHPAVPRCTRDPSPRWWKRGARDDASVVRWQAVRDDRSIMRVNRHGWDHDLGNGREISFKIEIKSEVKGNGNGQECPFHTGWVHAFNRR
jgi:hypothetical protein